MCHYSPVSRQILDLLSRMTISISTVFLTVSIGSMPPNIDVTVLISVSYFFFCFPRECFTSALYKYVDRH